MKIDSISATEFLNLVADALYSTHVPKHQVCTAEGCENPIRKGVRCEPCVKKRRQAQDRAYDAKRARKAKELKESINQQNPAEESESAAV